MENMISINLLIKIALVFIKEASFFDRKTWSIVNQFLLISY